MKNFLFVISFMFLISCNETNSILDLESDLTDEIVVLKERVSTWIPSDFKSKASSTEKRSTKGYSPLAHRDFLGYSFKNDIYPIEDTRNLGHQVVDIIKLDKDYPAYLKSWKTKGSKSTYFSYSTFNRYINKSTITKNVNGGFKLNLGLFSIGNKTNTKNVFRVDLEQEKRTVFGELNIVVRDSIHRMQYSTDIQNKIKTKYLYKDFEDELYNTHPSEFFKNYGGFILAEFVMGGRASAIFSGTYKKNQSDEAKEKSMDTEINASFGFKDKDGNSKDSISANLNVGRSSNTSRSVTKEFSSILMSIQTIGGNSSAGVFSTPKEINNTSLDLSGWISSLNDKKTHEIIQFGIDGLIPISDLIIERNLQIIIGNYYGSGVTNIDRLKEPTISIEVVGYQHPQIYIVGTVLYTRFGDAIRLKQRFMGNMYQPNFREMVKKYAMSEANRISKMLGVKITSNLFSSIDREPQVQITEQGKTYFDFDLLEGNLKKFVYKGTIYIIIDTLNVLPSSSLYNKKYALSIHNDRFIDEYAMRDLINRLPNITLNYEDFIRTYTIDAL